MNSTSTSRPAFRRSTIDFDYLGSKDGTYGEARLATSTILAINWNQFLLYPQHADIATTIVVPTIVLPGPDWTAETALPGPTRTGNSVTYAPATLERLVDSPLDAGSAFKRFTLLDCGRLHERDRRVRRSCLATRVRRRRSSRLQGDRRRDGRDLRRAALEELSLLAHGQRRDAGQRRRARQFERRRQRAATGSPTRGHLGTAGLL
jgi:hypothetical protein